MTDADHYLRNPATVEAAASGAPSRFVCQVVEKRLKVVGTRLADLRYCPFCGDPLIRRRGP